MEKRNKIIIFSVIIIFLIIAVAAPMYVWGVGGSKSVSDLSVSRENGEAVLAWSYDGAVDYYLIYKDGELINSTQKTEYKDTGLEEESSYEYRVVPVVNKEIGRATNVLLKAGGEEPPEEEPPEDEEEGLEVVYTFNYIGPGFDPYLIGEIQNKGIKNVNNVDVEAAFYLGDDMIGSTRQEHFHTTVLGYQVIESQETMPFSINLEMSHNEIVTKMQGNMDKELSVEIFIQNYSTTDEEPYTQYDVLHEVNRTEKSLKVNGEITNIGEETKQTAITIEYYNETYGLIGVKKTTKNNHQPGTTKQFQISLRQTYFKLPDGELLDDTKPMSEIVDNYEIKTRGK